MYIWKITNNSRFANNSYPELALLLRLFTNFAVGLRITLSETFEKKKRRYAYLVLENVGNFQLDAKIA